MNFITLEHFKERKQRQGCYAGLRLLGKAQYGKRMRGGADENVSKTDGKQSLNDINI